MNYEIENLVKKAADQIPKGGVWITLKNIQLGLEILFETIRQLIGLALVIAFIWYVLNFIPSADGLKTIFGIN
jgi:hypothetical protein